MSKYETYIEELENPETASEDALEAASDCLAFVESLHSVFRDNGYDLSEEPDLSAVESILDGMMGELAAASLFLSEDSFKSVPQMLRKIGEAFSQMPSQEVPTVIVRGYNRLANRIEATRVQQQQMKELLETQTTK
jgi:hypothetical protein